MDANEIEEAIERALRGSPVEFLNTRQAAAYLSLSVPRLEIWRSRGQGPPYTRVGRIIRYSRTDLNQWMREHQAPRRDEGVGR
ncbi:MAG: DNA-binding protein [Proteobacteria bacterium]|nr:MAG: DNA-binding protein [Pseudomonadota bacterium]